MTRRYTAQLRHIQGIFAMVGRQRWKFSSPAIRVCRYVLVCFLLAPQLALAQVEKPNVAILVYDGVQVIDHAIPFEVFGQFSLNNVYTVGTDRAPITTYMGLQVVPNFSFADAPAPDVLVLPGGDAGEAIGNPEIAAWIDRTVGQVDYVLTVCTGIFFLDDNEILDGKRITTWYDRQEELQRTVPRAEVVSDQVVVESGRLISSAGLGVDGALRVLALLHGPAWAEVVRLNMEYEPIPDSLRTPRVDLADSKLPNAVYSAFPWREAELLQYEGGRNEWAMAWRFRQDESLDSLRVRFHDALESEEGWAYLSEKTSGTEWTSRWHIDSPGEADWRAVIRLRDAGTRVDLEMSVRSSQTNERRR